MTGVDIEDHPDYPYELIVADAMEVLQDRDFLAGFDVSERAARACLEDGETEPTRPAA